MSLECLPAMSKHIAVVWDLTSRNIVDNVRNFRKDLPPPSSESSMETIGSSKFVVLIMFTTRKNIIEYRHFVKMCKYINIFLDLTFKITC